jgi:hypothetical protein
MNSEKLKIRTKQYALRIIIVIESNLVEKKRIGLLLKETNELVAMFVATRKFSRQSQI